jgi:cytochrome c oxidase assembly protein subunit 15
VNILIRLLGALAGIACVITFALVLDRKEKPLFTDLFSVFNGISGMVGKTVVDSDLSPYKITTHYAY